MKIEAVQDATLSNAEVLKHFNQEWDQQGEAGTEAENKIKPGTFGKPTDAYLSMHKDLNEYFTTASMEDGGGNLPKYSQYHDGAVRNLLQDLRRFQLTKAELVMILNLNPTDTILLDVIIEELDYRIPDEQEALLEIIKRHLSAAGGATNDKMDLEGKESEGDQANGKGG